MVPSNVIIGDSLKSQTVVDRRGRKLTLRRLTALDTLRLFKAAGPILSQNEPWLSMAGLAISVSQIDGIPVPNPVSEAQIESLIERIGDDGLATIADAIKEDESITEMQAQVGNSSGTPS